MLRRGFCEGRNLAVWCTALHRGMRCTLLGVGWTQRQSTTGALLAWSVGIVVPAQHTCHMRVL
jgi:hypothetical protein